MTSSLVGSEMCIRDRTMASACQAQTIISILAIVVLLAALAVPPAEFIHCLLYTSDAADDM
eukprot:4674765-Prorocentrum_lima.AAC.1